MDKVRIYELAKELNTNSKVLIEKLKKININVKNHMSILEDNELKAIYDYFGVKIKSVKDEDMAVQEKQEKQEEPVKPAVEPKPETTKAKKNAPRIIRTEVREIRTDASTGITTEITTKIKGDSRREVKTNIIKPETKEPAKKDFFEYKNRTKDRNSYDSRVQTSYIRQFENEVKPAQRHDEEQKEEIKVAADKELKIEKKAETAAAAEEPIKKVEKVDKKEKAEKTAETGETSKKEAAVERKPSPEKQDNSVREPREGSANRTHEGSRPQTSGRPYEEGRPQTGGRPYGEGRPQTPGRPYGEGRPQTPGRPYGEGRPQTGGRPYGEGRPQTPGRPYGEGRPQTGGRPSSRDGSNANTGNRPFNNNRKPAGDNFRPQKEKDFIGEQLREASKDMPKSAAQEQPKHTYRDNSFNRDKSKDVKKEAAKPAKTAGKQQDNNYDPRAIKSLSHEHKVNDILNNDDILLSLYDADASKRKGKKPFQGKNRRRDDYRGPIQPEPVKVVLKVVLPETITVKDLAEKLKKQAAEVIKKLFNYGIMATLNQEVDYDTAATISEEFGYIVEKEIVVSEEDILFDDSEDKEEELAERAPVVVVMGHVDHGKTSLLDAIRETNVTDREAGGITQHIGAYSVKINNRKITFLDTPGHEAFTAMRARGAQVTDIAILVVAADDGVMPQTIEAINHAKAANVSIIVAVNKIDKPGANPDKVKQELMEYGLVAEEWGGETTCVNVSAKKMEGIDTLLEMVLLVADMMNLKANPNKQAKGTIIEAKLDKGRGPVATVLVQRGTLKTGDFIVTGTTVGRIRAMTDDKAQKIKKAKPSTPVELVGLSEVPEAGEIFYAVEDERVAKQLVEKRRIKQREQVLGSSSRVTLDDLYNQIKLGKVKDLNIIVKADVQGSVEAIRQSLEKISNEEVRVKTIHGGVGAVTESDVMLANVSNAIIIGFNVRPEPSARDMAERENVDVKLYRVIYEAIDDITAAMKGMLEPKLKEVVLGHAEVRQTFKASGIGTIAGCYVTNGKILRNADIRIVRNGIVVHEGKIDSLKRFKDDAKEVATGFECGINLEKFNDIKEGDIIEAYTMEKIAIE